MIGWIDSLVGRMLYPVIVRLSHWFDWNQYQIYRYSYVLSSMLVFIEVWETGIWFLIAYNGFWMLMFILSAIALDGEPPRESENSKKSIWRVIFVMLVVATMVMFIVQKEHGSLVIAICLTTLGEYARSIDTPRERKSKANDRAS